MLQSLALAACLTLGDPTLDLPAEVKGKVGAFVTVTAKTDGKIVRWVLMDDGPALIPPHLLKDDKTAVVLSLRPGKFRLLCYTSKDDVPSTPAITLLSFQGEAPPTPPPPPPPPADLLTQRFQDAYTRDGGDAPLKASQLGANIGLYQAMADHCEKDTTLKTLGDVFSDLQKTAKSLLKDGVLMELRAAIATEVSARLGTDPAMPLDSSTRGRAVATFQRIASALQAVK